MIINKQMNLETNIEERKETLRYIKVKLPKRNLPKNITFTLLNY